ncbi:MAG: hypothetical protein FJ295_17460, partial [Planctomycetes bacterium]|nr:hypothetical protein [Planctomycetota bacterium]
MAQWKSKSAAMVLLTATFILVTALPAQQTPGDRGKSDAPAAAPPKNSPSSDGPDELDSLADRQSRLADRYTRLEELMTRMAAFEAASNPKREKLLKLALQQSKEKLTHNQLSAISRFLNQNVLDRAMQGQGAARADLQALLELLQSENRADRLKSEQARIREYIKEIERIQRQERSIQGQTESGGDAKQLAEEQARLAEKTGQLADKIRENEEGTPPSNASEQDGKQQDGKQQDGKQQDGKQQDGKQQDGKQQDGKQQDG